MMKEKDMVSDYLSELNSSLAGYAQIISQCDNQELRNAFIQIRNADEKKQLELYQAAKQRNYYTPASQASQQDIQQVKQQFTQGNTMNAAMMNNQQMNQGQQLQ